MYILPIISRLDIGNGDLNIVQSILEVKRPVGRQVDVLFLLGCIRSSEMNHSNSTRVKNAHVDGKLNCRPCGKNATVVASRIQTALSRKTGLERSTAGPERSFESLTALHSRLARGAIGCQISVDDGETTAVDAEAKKVFRICIQKQIFCTSLPRVGVDTSRDGKKENGSIDPFRKFSRRMKFVLCILNVRVSD